MNNKKCADRLRREAKNTPDSIVMTEDIIEKLREQYNIPKELKAFLFQDANHEAVANITKNLKKEEILFEKRYLWKGKAEFNPFGYYSHKNFKLVTFWTYSSEMEEQYCGFVVFAKDVMRFLDTIDRSSLILKSGIYKVGHSCGSYFFDKVNDSKPENVVLNKNIVETFRDEISEFVKNEKIYSDNNFYYKRGFLMYGKPGNGKTLTIRNLIRGVNAITVLCDANNVGEIGFIKKFLQLDAYKDTLKIIVLEDIDGVEKYNRSDLLNLIDGIVTVHKTVFIATTNFPENLDVAISNRPSRFDAVMKIEEPNEHSRRKLIKQHFKKVKKDELDKAVTMTEGFSGAYFKEMYLLSVIYKCNLIKAATMMKERFAEFAKFNKEKEDYIG